MERTKSHKKKFNWRLTSFQYKLLSFLLILVGSFLIFLPTVKSHKISLSKVGLGSEGAANYSIRPAKIYIPKINKVLYVSEGKAEGDTWSVSSTGVSYLTTSTLPGKEGNSVLYGHNTDDMLGRLPNLSEGDEIYVILNDGSYVKYSTFETKEVEPKQVEILNQTTDSRLTIYTCTGLLDSARFVVVLRLEGSQKVS